MFFEIFYEFTFVFCFGAISTSAQKLFLEGSGDPVGMLRMEPGSVTCKTNTLLAELSL